MRLQWERVSIAKRNMNGCGHVIVKPCDDRVTAASPALGCSAQKTTLAPSRLPLSSPVGDQSRVRVQREVQVQRFPPSGP
jgi:hypothetical protein